MNEEGNEGWATRTEPSILQVARDTLNLTPRIGLGSQLTRSSVHHFFFRSQFFKAMGVITTCTGATDRRRWSNLVTDYANVISRLASVDIGQWPFDRDNVLRDQNSTDHNYTRTERLMASAEMGRQSTLPADLRVVRARQLEDWAAEWVEVRLGATDF